MRHRPNRLPVAPPVRRHSVHSPRATGEESALERVRRIAREHAAAEKPFDPTKRGTWRGSSKDLVINGQRRMARNAHADQDQLLTEVRAVLDTALSDDHSESEISDGSYLVCWNTPDAQYDHLVIAVIGSYTDPTDEAEAVSIAQDYAEEKRLIRGSKPPSFVAVVSGLGDKSPERRARFEDLQQGRFVEIRDPESGHARWDNIEHTRGKSDGDFWMSNYTSGSDYSGSDVELSNFRVLKEMCDGLESEHGQFWVELSGGHGTYGIAFNVYATPDEIVEVLNGLEDYPIADEDHHSNMTVELESENWERSTKHDFKLALEKAFGGNADDVSDEDLWQCFHDAAEESSTYWESQSGTGDMYIDIDRIMKKLDEPPAGFVVEDE